MHPNAMGGQRSAGFGGRQSDMVREAGVPAPSGMPTTDPRCKGHTSDGGRCRARHVKDDTLCIGHKRQRDGA